MLMDPLNLLRAAIRKSNAYAELRDAVCFLQFTGLTKEAIENLLMELRCELREQQPDSLAEEAVLGVLDTLEGWCHPSASLTKPSLVNR